MMNKILVSVFDSQTAAFEGLTALKELHREGEITLYASSVVSKDDNGKATIQQQADRGPVGAVTGLVGGALVGLIAGPAGAAVGAYVGGVGGLMFDVFTAGFNLDFVDDVTLALKPGTTAVIADVDETWVTPVDTRLGALGATTLRREPGDVMDEKLARDTDNARAALDELNAEVRQAASDRRAAIEASIATQRAKVQGLVDQIDKTLDDDKAQLESRLAILEAQRKAAAENQRERISARGAELKARNETRRQRLAEARSLAKQSIEKTREALVS
jgi:uncharacterized membrane protein